MILRISTVLSALALGLGAGAGAAAEVAPDITTVTDGYNVIAKLPALNAPFLYKDTSRGADEPWTTRQDPNALLLNISLPYDSAHLAINNAALLSTSDSRILPKVYANQVLLDTSTTVISELVAVNALDNPGGGYFGLSYRYSLRRITGSAALRFRFDVMELFSDLTDEPLSIPLDDAQQKILEIVLLPRPLLSAGDVGSAYEIVRAGLVERPDDASDEDRGHRKSMWFQDWDDHGKKGTTRHFVNRTSDSMTAWITSGVWTLVIFVLAVIALFVVICLFCIFGLGLGGDEYLQAQTGKRRSSGRSGNDVEMARRFRSAEELGMRAGGRVVGVGKSD